MKLWCGSEGSLGGLPGKSEGTLIFSQDSGPLSRSCNMASIFSRFVAETKCNTGKILRVAKNSKVSQEPANGLSKPPKGTPKRPPRENPASTAASGMKGVF